MCNNDFELNYQKMVNIIEQLSQGKVCLNCGNNMFIQTGICPSCGKHIINIEYAAKDIEKILLNIRNTPLEFYHNHPLIVSYIKNNLISQTETKNNKNTQTVL